MEGVCRKCGASITKVWGLCPACKEQYETDRLKAMIPVWDAEQEAYNEFKQAKEKYDKARDASNEALDLFREMWYAERKDD